MLRTVLSATLAAVVLVGACATAASAVEPSPLRHHYRHQTTPELFSNYYVPPSGCNSVPAALYVSPLPVPPNVGHTYVPYQPLMPHEFLYKHHRTYYRWHYFGNYTKTCVLWW